jgi:hypothetical protein
MDTTRTRSRVQYLLQPVSNDVIINMIHDWNAACTIGFLTLPVFGIVDSLGRGKQFVVGVIEGTPPHPSKQYCVWRCNMACRILLFIVFCFQNRRRQSPNTICCCGNRRYASSPNLTKRNSVDIQSIPSLVTSEVPTNHS